MREHITAAEARALLTHAEAERDEARRVLLALADGCDRAMVFRSRGILSGSELNAVIVLAAARAVGVTGSVRPEALADALRRLCGVSDG